MKQNHSHTKNCLARVLLILVLALRVMAQPGGMGKEPGINLGVTKFFGDVKFFTASADIVVKTGGQNMTFASEFALLDDKSRVEMDLSKMMGKDMPPEMTATLKSAGLDKCVFLGNHAKKENFIVLPNAKVYATAPVPAEEAALTEKEPKLEKKELGKETVEGHPTVKYQVVLTSEKGQKTEAIIWEATDLKNFPIKIQATMSGVDQTITYRNIKTEKPAASLFEIPAGFTKHESFQAMMMSAMMKGMMGQ